MDSTAITPPAECALVVAIPWERTSFLEQLDPASPREFAKWYRLDHGGPWIAPEALWTAYQPREAAPIARILAECQALGVEVCGECTLSSVTALAARKRVVILAAHWRSGLLQLTDLLDPPGFIRRLSTERSGVLALLRERISAAGHANPLADAAGAPGDLGALVRLVNMLQEVLGKFPLQVGADGLRTAEADASYYMATNRQLLNEACAAELAPGAGLELSEATHTATAVAQAFGGHFSGCIDMAVCNSYLLAETIKRANPDCLIMANRQKTSPVARLLIAHQVLKKLSRTPANYLRVALDIREHLRGSGHSA